MKDSDDDIDVGEQLDELGDVADCPRRTDESHLEYGVRLFLELNELGREVRGLTDEVAELVVLLERQGRGGEGEALQ